MYPDISFLSFFAKKLDQKAKFWLNSKSILSFLQKALPKS